MSDFQADIDAVRRIAAVPSILEVICRITGLRFAAVARVTEDRWVACEIRDGIAFGLVPGGELRVETTLCNDIRQSGEAVAIDDVAADDIYRGHPTPALYGFQSYISTPIILPDGRFFGTLCAIDPRPAQVKTPEMLGMFRLFAELIAFHLQAHEKLDASEASLVGERRTAELREQFIAVLGHDLRNPLAAIDAGAKLLLKTPLDAKATHIAKLIQSSVSRMSGLIDNMLDFARTRLGGGMVLNRDSATALEDALAQVIAEGRASWPERVIETDIAMTAAVRCDSARVAQLFSNLLGNALTHGAPDQPVRVRAATDAQSFILSVANAGTPIPPEKQERLFQPFTRGADALTQHGLGLGLYIATEIARAHGGTIDVVSTAQETVFTFRMPLR